ncbi:hypothetical protein Scep_020576 [Stephania cephalantha]|uniref:Uncharacterized protein n=1 Tax=Stephania cephalantha TaxID=152367 RepID=A0AAP0IE57_9MAGN
MAMANDQTTTFDMGALQANLPQSRRGLSRYYSGKSRSFTCMADVHCVEDLKKPDTQEAKKRKKHSERQAMEMNNIPPYHCRRVSSTAHLTPPCIGV